MRFLNPVYYFVLFFETVIRLLDHASWEYDARQAIKRKKAEEKKTCV